MDSDFSRKALDDYALTLIKHKAHQLTRRAGFTADDQEDLEQDLKLHLLEQLPKFNPTRGAFSTFVDRVVAHKAADILDARFAACRDCRLRIGSLHDTVPLPDGEEVLVEDMDFEDAVRVQHGLAERPGHTEAELKIDLERALALLSPEQRELCLRLMTSTVAEISAATGVPRPTLYDSMARIRDTFARAGLGDYLEEPDKSERVPVSKVRRETR